MQFVAVEEEAFFSMLKLILLSHHTHAKSNDPSRLALCHHGIDIFFAKRLSASERTQGKVGNASQKRDCLCMGKERAAA